jgi:predicted RNase H-like nuclease (RuvC/YqgF family)
LQATKDAELEGVKIMNETLESKIEACENIIRHYKELLQSWKLYFSKDYKNKGPYVQKEIESWERELARLNQQLPVRP